MGHEVTRSIEWDMAHRIPRHGALCQHLHGHHYRAEITCSAVRLDNIGVVIDFSVIKQFVGAWVDKHWDHNTAYQTGDSFMEALNDAATRAWDGPVARRIWYVMDDPPTAENLAKTLHGVASELLTSEDIKVVRIDLWETPNCRARYEL